MRVAKSLLTTLARPLGSLLICLIFLLHTTGYWNISLLDRLEQIAYDIRINLTLPETGDSNILIIDIDEDSLREIGQFPWPRDYIADLVYLLFGEYGIQAMGFDIVFAEPDRRGASQALQELIQQKPELKETLTPLLADLNGDQRLAEMLAQTPAILGFYMDRVKEENTPSVGILPDPLPIESPVSPELFPIPEANRFSANQPVLQHHALSAGFFDNPLVDSDGVFRRVPMLQRYQGNYYPSLSLSLIRSVLGMPPVELIVSGGDENPSLEALDVGGFRIPVDNQTGALVPYYGGRDTFEYISVVDIFRQTVPKEKLKGAIVLLGTSAPGLLDLRTTPVDSVYPGVEVHANLIAGILHQSFRHQPTYTLGGEILLLAFLGIFLTLTLPRMSPLMILITTGLLFSGIWYSNLLLWSHYHWVFPLASPLLASALIIAYQLAYGYLVESRGKRQLTRLFGQYVPPELVDEMNQNPEQISLEGKNREMTVLFSDVRGFTSISEGLPPEELTRLMNAFLTPMTGVIHNHRGTIDKYIGDAIMAFWGAPLNDPQHAQHAVQAGLDMVARLKTLAPEFKKQGWPELKIGVGLNTGPMNVGNMGSEFRMAYTVLGDAVNLGARLEGLTKTYGVDILVSDKTAADADQYLYRELDRVRVKGKQKPVAIFEPIALKGEVSAETQQQLERYHQALEYYRHQDWGQAETLLLQLKQEDKHPVYEIYLKRIDQYQQTPPSAEWDGVFTHLEK